MKLATFAATLENLDSPTDEINPLDNPNAPASEVAVENQMAPADAAEAESEMTQEVAEVNEVDAGIEAGTDAVDTIGELQEGLSEGGEEEPVSDVEVEAVQATHESIMKSLGLDYPFPTMESMSPTTQRSQLIATLESDKKSVLSRIADGLKAAGRALLNFIQGLIRNNWVLRKYLEYVRKKVAGISNSARPKQDKMTKSASAMSVNGTAGMSSVGAMEDTAKSLIEISNVLVDKLNTMNFKLNVENVEKMDEKGFVSGKTVPLRNTDNTIGYLTGDRAFGVDSKAWLFGQQTVYENGENHGHQPKTAEEIAVASKPDMEKLLKAADGIIAGLKAFDAKHSKIKTIVSTLINYAAGVLTVYPSIVSKSAENAFKMQANLMGVRIVISAGLSRLPLEAWKTAKAFIDYANNSANQYKGQPGGLDSEEDMKNAKQIGMNPEKVHKADWEVV